MEIGVAYEMTALTPGHLSQLAIAEQGWTAAVEREWLAYLAALKAAKARVNNAATKRK